MYTRQGKSSTFLWFNFYVVLHPAGNQNRSKMFFKIDVLKSFSKFIGKQLYQSFSFNKVVGLRPTILLKKRLRDRSFPENFAKWLEHLKAFLIGFYY